MSKLANLRKGIPDHRIVFIPGTDTKVAIVSLNNKDIIESREKAVEFVTEHPVDVDTGDLILNMFVLAKSLRNPDDLEGSFTEGFEDISTNLDPKSVYELHNTFIEVQNGELPDLEYLTPEEFEDIKKKSVKMELNELDGELQTILKHFHRILIFKNSLKDK